MKIVLFFSLFLISSAWASPCGKEGIIADRVKECNLTQGNFVLVARDDKGFEIFRDEKTKLIWADRISSDYNHYGSQKACSDDIPGLQMLKDVKWRLPTIKEFEEAASNGMKTALPRMGYWFWTSTPVTQTSKRSKRRRVLPSQAFLWDGTQEVSDVGDIKDGASVRCVGKE